MALFDKFAQKSNDSSFLGSLKKSVETSITNASRAAEEAAEKVKPTPKPQPKPQAKTWPQAKTATSPWSSISDFASKAIDDASKAISSAARTARTGYQSASNALEEIANRKVSEWLSNIDFDSTIKSLEKYQQESGQDISALTNFVKQLRNVKK